MKKAVLSSVFVLLFALFIAACAQQGKATSQASPAAATASSAGTEKASPTAPPAAKTTPASAADVYALVNGQPVIPNPPTAYPKGELGRLVKLGEDIIYNTHTHPLTKDLVGNDLDCTSCHLDGGKAKSLGTFIGSAAAFPAYSPREKTVQTLQDRIDNCFMRSMNGKRPIIDSEASVAMAAYITWLSSGLPIQMNPAKPINPFYSKLWVNKNLVPLAKSATHVVYLEGQKLYSQKCAVCHGEDGQGKRQGDKVLYPPVWGDRAYNTGAGLAHPVKMATWLQYNMPPDGSGLSDQEAVAIAIYVDAQPHPDFNLQDHLLPKEEMGYYNSKVLQETHSVAKNFAALGLDVNVITGAGPQGSIMLPTATPTSAVFDPEAFYAASCAACHGDHAEGKIGPALKEAGAEQDEYVQIILKGKDSMPAFQDKLTEAQALQLVQWLANLK